MEPIPKIVFLGLIINSLYNKLSLTAKKLDNFPVRADKGSRSFVMIDSSNKCSKTFSGEVSPANIRQEKNNSKFTSK